MRCAIVVFPAPSMPSIVMKRPRTDAASAHASKKLPATRGRHVAFAGSELFYRLRLYRATEPPLLSGVWENLVQAEAGRSTVLGGRGSVRTVPEVRRAHRPAPGRPSPGLLLRLLRHPRGHARRRLGRPEPRGEVPLLLRPLPLPVLHVPLDPRRRPAAGPEPLGIRLVDRVPDLQLPLNRGRGCLVRRRIVLLPAIPPDGPHPLLQLVQEGRLLPALPRELRLDGEVAGFVPLEQRGHALRPARPHERVPRAPEREALALQDRLERVLVLRVRSAVEDESEAHPNRPRGGGRLNLAGDPDLEAAHSLDRAHEDVAVADLAYPCRGPRSEDVPALQRHHAGGVVDQGGDLVHHLPSVAVLYDPAVHLDPDPKVVRVPDLAGGRNRGDRCERVEALRDGPRQPFRPRLGLEVPRGDVEHDRVSEHEAHRPLLRDVPAALPEDDRELALLFDPPRFRRKEDRAPGLEERGRGLQEEHRGRR